MVDHVRRTDRSGFKAEHGGRPCPLRRALCRGVRCRSSPRPTGCDAPWRPCWRSRGPLSCRAAWGNGEANWLTRAQRLMQDAHFAVEQDMRFRRAVPFQFNGTGGIWRREAVEDAGAAGRTIRCRRTLIWSCARI